MQAVGMRRTRRIQAQVHMGRTLDQANSSSAASLQMPSSREGA